MAVTDTLTEISSAAELTELLGTPTGRALTKERTRLHARDVEWLADDMIVKGHRPRLAVLVEIEQIFFHCMKAFMRSRLWEPESWHPGAVPPHAQIVKTVQPCQETLEELERHYGPRYEELLYG